MQRVLDIDLDFFVTPVVHWPPDDARRSVEDYAVWTDRDALAFLAERCGLDESFPGFVTENHAELFPLWREAIAEGILSPPFHVTHVDAHADLGLGDAGYAYLMTSLLLEQPNRRQHPKLDRMSGLNDGNFLLFAIACRWIGELAYIYGEGGGGDELFLAMQGFDVHSNNIQLAAMTKAELDKLLHRRGEPAALSIEPPVAYRTSAWTGFRADAKYDFICLTRSPPYTPPTADWLYDVIRDRYVDPIALARRG